MQAQSLETIDPAIRRLQKELAALGPMRPGTLSRQYRDPQRRRGAYYQLSYTYRMKSKTEYVRAIERAQVRAETAIFRRFKKLTARWVDLALQRSRLGRIRVRQKPSGGES